MPKKEIPEVLREEPLNAITSQEPVSTIIEQEPVKIALATIHDMINGFFAHLPFLIVGLIIIGIFYIIGKIVKKIINTTGEKTKLDAALLRILASIGSGVTLILGILIAAVVIFPDFNPSKLLTGLGISSVAIGFAFKDIFENFLAGILILWRQPFKLKDQIITSDFEGTVIGIDIRATQIKTYDGEVVIIPNGDIFKNPVQVNTAFRKRRVQFGFGIGYNEPIEDARKIAFDVLERTEGVLDDPKPWVYVTEHASSSINFNIYFWTESTQANVLKVRDQVATQMKLELDKAGIEIPFPQRVLYVRKEEDFEDDVMSKLVKVAETKSSDKPKMAEKKAPKTSKKASE